MSGRMLRFGLLAPIALASACDGGGNPDICSDVGPRIPYLNAIEGVEVRLNARACVEHWASRLSFSHEAAADVADAAMGACQAGISEGLAGAPEKDQDEWRRSARELAIFRAVQQRAGNCGIPPLQADLSN